MKAGEACQRVSPMGERAVEWGAWLEGVVSYIRFTKTLWVTAPCPPRETQVIPEAKPVSGSSFSILVGWHSLREQRQGCLKKFNFN